MRAAILSLVILLLIRQNHCGGYESLQEIERLHLREKALSFVRFLLAQRVDRIDQDAKDQRSVLDLVKDKTGKEELEAMESLEFDYLSVASSSLSDQYYYSYKVLYNFVFQTLLGLGMVRKWPRYYYDPDNSEIIILPEVISMKSNNSGDDYGPPVPELEKLHVLSEEDILKKPDEFFKGNVEWVPRTPDIFRNSGLYELVQIIPLPVLASFCELFSVVWHTIDDRKRQLLSAPFRIYNAADTKYRSISLAVELTTDHLTEDPVDLDNDIFNETNFEFNIRKHVLWAPGMLYYGFKNRVKLADSVFDRRVETIVGKDHSKFAENIHNRILDLLDQVGYHKINTKEEMEKIASKVRTDYILFHQMKKVFEKLIIFGKTRERPYQNNLTQWEQENGETYNTSRWRIIFEEDQSLEDTDDRLKIADDINVNCKANAIVNPSMEDSDYKNLEDFELGSLLSNDRDPVLVFREFFQKFPDRNLASLTDLINFVRDEIKSYYFDTQCHEKNLLCSRVHALCQYNILEYYNLTYDESDKYPNFYHKKHRFVSTISFNSWCSGSRFKKIKQLTTDSAVMRVLTFNVLKPNILNKKIYTKLWDEYKESGLDEKVDFPGFVDMELQKFNTTASKTLEQACKLQNRIKNSPTGYIQRMCQSSHYLLSPFYCILNDIQF